MPLKIKIVRLMTGRETKMKDLKISNILKTDDYIKNCLISADDSLKNLLESCGHIDITLSTNYFEAIVRSIVGQQLSKKVADVIRKRVLELMGGVLIPEKIINMRDEEFRKIGVSYSKIGYIKNLSRAVISKELNLDNLDHKGNEEVINSLVAVKGIGIWTAEMFLIFSLGRPDVFSFSDVGLQRAIKWVYQLDESPKKNELIVISNRWKPYRTFASLYLWQAVNENLLGSRAIIKGDKLCEK